jgi:hypothetical protein
MLIWRTITVHYAAHETVLEGQNSDMNDTKLSRKISIWIEHLILFIKGLEA